MEYLGSVALSRQSSDLMALQQPLKELYMRYLAKDDQGVQDNDVFANEVGRSQITLPGSIEISKTGLKVNQRFLKILVM